MNRNYITGLIIVIIVAAGGWFLYQSSQSNTAPTVNENNSSASVENAVSTSTAQTSTTTQSTTSTDTTSMSHTVEVKLTSSGFSPSTVNIKQGDTVTWTNETSGQMWVASGVHPTHTLYSGTTLQEHCPNSGDVDFDECKAVGNGGSWSFTFDKVGTWKYHNHVDASKFGSVVVE